MLQRRAQSNTSISAAARPRPLRRTRALRHTHHVVFFREKKDPHFVPELVGKRVILCVAVVRKWEAGG